MSQASKHGRSFRFERSYFGSNGYGHLLGVFGNTANKYMVWDNVNNKLVVNGDVEINGASIGAVSRIKNVITTPLLITSADDSKVITLNKADGIAVTLPSATGSGLRLKFVIGTTITSNSTTIKVTTNDIMTGSARVLQDGGDTIVGFETASDSDTITLNGSTTGGIKGDIIELIDISTDLWLVEVKSSATGTEATPFSATVT